MKILNGSFLDIMIHCLSIIKDGKQATDVIKEVLGEGEEWLPAQFQKLDAEMKAL